MKINQHTNLCSLYTSASKAFSCNCSSNENSKSRRNFSTTKYINFKLFLLQPTNAQIFFTIFSLIIMFAPTCFDKSVSSSGRFKNFYFAKLHKFLIWHSEDHASWYILIIKTNEMHWFLTFILWIELYMFRTSSGV